MEAGGGCLLGAVEGIRRNFFSSAPQMSLNYTNSFYFQYFRNFQKLGSDYELALNSREVTTNITTKYFSRI